MDYSQRIGHVYEHLEDYNPTKERKVLVVFDDMIVDMEPNKTLSPIVTELLLKPKKKTHHSTCFISLSYFKVPKTIRLNTVHYFIIKVPNKKIPQIALNHLSDIESKDFMNLYKDYTEKSLLFLVNDTPLTLDNQVRFRKYQL